jgi:hypothetical protein
MMPFSSIEKYQGFMDGGAKMGMLLHQPTRVCHALGLELFWIKNQNNFN